MGGERSYRQEVKRKVEHGWQIETETSERVTLVKREYGDPGVHIVIALFTIWWLMGIPNLLYAAYKYFTGSQRTIVWKRPGTAGEGETTEAVPESE